MATYQVSQQIQFRHAVTRKDLERVINAGEKASIIAVAINGMYTVKLHADGLLASMIMDEDIKPSNEQ